MIRVENISKSYGDLLVLNSVNFSVQRGEVLGLLGVNGAGKSTLMKIMAGILPADKGQVEIFGHTFANDELVIKKNVGYLSEDNPLYAHMYVKEYLNYIAGIYGTKKDAIAPLIEQTGLAKEYKKKIGALSRGNRQRVGIAQALLHNPGFLILDEPASGLDPNQRDDLNRLLIELSGEKIILFSTHILQDVKDICSRLLLINKGQIVADKSIEEVDSVEEIFRNLTNENNS